MTNIKFQTSSNDPLIKPVSSTGENKKGLPDFVSAISRAFTTSSNATVSDFILEPMWIMIKDQNKILKWIIGFFSLILWVGITGLIFLKMKLENTTNSNSKLFSTISKVPGIQMLKTLSVQILLILQWVFAALTQPLSAALAYILFLGGGVLLIWSSMFGSQCKHYLKLAVGIVQVLYVVIKANLLSNIISSTAILTLFNYTTIAAVAILIVDIFLQDKLCGKQQINSKGNGINYED